MVDIKLVIARYNEKIDWIKSPNHVIYNKGNQLNDPTKIVIEMPNVGREGHTYLTHIVKNYNNLNDYTVFLQGDPFPHSGNLSLNLSKIHDSISKGEKITFKFLSEWLPECEFSGCKHHWEPLPLKESYKRIFGSEPPTEKFTFGAGAQFIVSKETIHKRPLAFYKNIISFLDYSVNPMEGYIIERFWGFIFSH